MHDPNIILSDGRAFKTVTRTHWPSYSVLCRDNNLLPVRMILGPGLGLGARPVLRGLRGPGCGVHRPLAAAATTYRLYTSSTSAGSISHVPLAYDLHKPTKPVSDDPDRESPILFLHGLFGSKKNNRGISKYVVDFLSRRGGRFRFRWLGRDENRWLRGFSFIV